MGIFDAAGKYYTGANKAEQKAYADLGTLIKTKIANVEWGRYWITFVDMPHYQLATGGKSTSDVRKLFEAGKAFHV